MHVAPFCAGCGQGIFDRYFLCLCVTERGDEQGQAWHCRCLTCSVCGVTLDPGAVAAAAAPCPPTGQLLTTPDENDAENGQRRRMVCYYRDGLLLCRDDYNRRIGENGPWRRCNLCKCPVHKDEMVMKVDRYVYHLACFRCFFCGQVLRTGDEFGLREAGLVCCRRHCEYPDPSLLSQPLQSPRTNLLQRSVTLTEFPAQALLDPVLQCNDQQDDKDLLTEQLLQINEYQLTELTPSKKRLGSRARKRKKASQSHDRHMTDTAHASSSPDSESGRSPTNSDLTLTMHLSRSHSLPHMRVRRHSDSPDSPQGAHSTGQARTKRMRTSFKHQQLRAMKQYFGINHNPDAKDLKQLAQKTGLTKRVLQVWFQNARAKYRRSLLKQEGAMGGVGVAHGESPSRSEHSPSNDGGGGERCQDSHGQSPCSCTSSYVSANGDGSNKEMESGSVSGHSIFTEALAHTDYY